MNQAPVAPIAPMRASSARPLYEDVATFLASIEQQQRGSAGTAITTTTQNSPGLVAMLQHRVQALNLGTLVWDIIVEPGTERSAQRFIGTLTIGVRSGQDITVSITDPGIDPRGSGLPSKKDVKAVLAQRALLLLDHVSPVPRQEVNGIQTTVPATQADNNDGINWIGRILEYNNSIPMEHRMFTYAESSTVPPNGSGPVLFSCVLSIAIAAPATDLGVQTLPLYSICTFPSTNPAEKFQSKKAAKQYCSRLAGEALIERGILQGDGSLLPKVINPPQNAQSSSGETSILADVVRICHELGLPQVQYKFTSPSGDPTNAFVDCSAHFQSTTGLPDPFVTVQNVYGKKKAKEACARSLLSRFPKVREWRLSGSGVWKD